MTLLLSIGCLASSWFVLNSRKKDLSSIKTIDFTGSYPYLAKDTFKLDKDSKFSFVVLKPKEDQVIRRVLKGTLEWDEPYYFNTNQGISIPLGNSTPDVDYKEKYNQANIEGFDFSKVFDDLSKDRIKESGSVKILKKYLSAEIYEKFKYKVAYKWRVEEMKFSKGETIWGLYHHKSDKIIRFEKSHEQLIQSYKVKYYFWPYVGIGASSICLAFSLLTL